MRKIAFIELALILGGAAVVPADWCTAMQNVANEEGDNWSSEFWDEWASEYEKRGCPHGIIYG